MYKTSRVEISPSDYDDLKNDRWSFDEFSYWTVKYKSGFSPEGYGLINPRVYKEQNKCFLEWEHSESCD